MSVIFFGHSLDIANTNNSIYLLLNGFWYHYLALVVLFYKSIIYLPIGTMVRGFANGPVDRGLIPGQVIPKTKKMVLNASLLNTRHYKVWIKGEVEQSRERSGTLPYTLV